MDLEKFLNNMLDIYNKWSEAPKEDKAFKKPFHERKFPGLARLSEVLRKPFLDNLIWGSDLQTYRKVKNNIDALIKIAVKNEDLKLVKYLKELEIYFENSHDFKITIDDLDFYRKIYQENLSNDLIRTKDSFQNLLNNLHEIEQTSGFLSTDAAKFLEFESLINNIEAEISKIESLEQNFVENFSTSEISEIVFYDIIEKCKACNRLYLQLHEYSYFVVDRVGLELGNAELINFFMSLFI